MAVCDHHRLSLLFRADHDRPRNGGSRVRDRVPPHQETGSAAHHQAAGQTIHDQLRVGSGHRHRAGIPIRHELERLFAIRRGYLRCAARHRGIVGVLHGIHLPRPMDLRLGSAAGEVAQSVNVSGGDRDNVVRLFHPGGEFVHAESRRLHLQPGHQTCRAHRLRCRPHQ